MTTALVGKRLCCADGSPSSVTVLSSARARDPVGSDVEEGERNRVGAQRSARLIRANDRVGGRQQIVFGLVDEARPHAQSTGRSDAPETDWPRACWGIRCWDRGRRRLSRRAPSGSRSLHPAATCDHRWHRSSCRCPPWRSCSSSPGWPRPRRGCASRSRTGLSIRFCHRW